MDVLRPMRDEIEKQITCQVQSFEKENKKVVKVYRNLNEYESPVEIKGNKMS